MSIALRMNGRNYAIVTSLSALTPVCSVPTSLHTRIGAQTLARAASPVRIWRTDTGLRACERRWPAIIEAPAKPASRAWQTQQARECRGEPLMRHHCWPERVSSTGDFHVFETFSWCDHRTCKHRLAQFSAHELVFHTRPLCHVNRSVGGAGRRLHLKRANDDHDVNRHRCTQVSRYVGPLLAPARLLRGLCVRTRASGEVYGASVSDAHRDGEGDNRNNEMFHGYSPGWLVNGCLPFREIRSLR